MPAIPKDLPPIFMAWAQDDEVAGSEVAHFYDVLKAAGDRPEAHVFSNGGHGFGIEPQGTTSDHWAEDFYWWLKDRGLTSPPAHG